MLYLMLHFLLLSAVCFWAGLLFYDIFPRVPGYSPTSGRPVVSYLLSGLAVLAGLGQWIVLVMPLGGKALGLVLVLLGGLTLARIKTIRNFVLNEFRKRDGGAGGGRHKTLFFVFLGALLFMILVLNAGPTMMDDTESYHIQMVKWAREYGSVPGIANLHLRFGLNSSWFVAIGLLSPDMRGINNYLVLNGMISTWFCIYLAGKIFNGFGQTGQEGKRNGGLAALVVLLLGLVCWPLVRGNAASANYDFISTAFLVVLFIEASASRSGPVAEWLTWPIFLFTVRIINYPLLLLLIPWLVSLLRGRKPKPVLGLVIIFLFWVVPYVTRNVILSGYPFFPVYQLDWFSVDWKADKHKLIEMMEYIKYYSRINPVHQSLLNTMDLPFRGWVTGWFSYLSVADKWIVSLALASYLFLLVFWKKTRELFHGPFRIILAVMPILLISWFFVSPDLRFAYGALLFGIYCSVRVITTSFHWQDSKGQWAVMAALAATLLVYSTRKMAGNEQYRNWITPRALPVPPTREVLIDGILLHIPEKILNNWNPRCYDAPLPCLYHVDPRLRARGKDIRSGFRLEYGENPGPNAGEYEITKQP